MQRAKSSKRNLVECLVMLAVMFALPSASVASENPLLGPVFLPGPARSASTTGLVTVVDPATLSCVQTTTFDDVPGGAAPGVNYDGIFASVGVYFSERFVGQSLSYSGNFDVVTGAPSDPLFPQVGLPGQNLNVFAFSTNVLDGLGPLGFPDFDAIGEGSVAMYFPIGQSEIGFQLVGGNAGTATLHFYRSNGSLIDTIVISGLAETSYGFKRAGGVPDIAGVLILTDDAAGIGIDNVCHDVGVVPTLPASWGQVKALYR